MNRRGVYTSETHQVTTAALRSEQMCNYDLDDLDIRWLNIVNGERALMGMYSALEFATRVFAFFHKTSKGFHKFDLKQCISFQSICLSS